MILMPYITKILDYHLYRILKQRNPLKEIQNLGKSSVYRTACLTNSPNMPLISKGFFFRKEKVAFMGQPLFDLGLEPIESWPRCLRLGRCFHHRISGISGQKESCYRSPCNLGNRRWLSAQ